MHHRASYPARDKARRTSARPFFRMFATFSRKRYVGFRTNPSVTSRMTSKKRPDLTPAKPRPAPAVLMSWQGKPVQRRGMDDRPDVATQKGASRESNAGPRAPEARIIPLDHWPGLPAVTMSTGCFPRYLVRAARSRVLISSWIGAFSRSPVCIRFLSTSWQNGCDSQYSLHLAMGAIARSSPAIPENKLTAFM